LEKISVSFNFTSKTPPEDGRMVREDILSLFSFNKLSARLTALGR
jgi:hypothetical protein